MRQFIIVFLTELVLQPGVGGEILQPVLKRRTHWRIHVHTTPHYTHTYEPGVREDQRERETVGSPRMGFTGSRELPCGCQKPNLSHVQEQSVLSSLRPLWFLSRDSAVTTAEQGSGGLSTHPSFMAETSAFPPKYCDVFSI